MLVGLGLGLGLGLGPERHHMLVGTGSMSKRRLTVTFKIFQDMSRYFKICQDILQMYLEVHRRSSPVGFYRYTYCPRSRQGTFKIQDMSRYVEICRDMSRYVKICRDMSRYVKICQDMSRYVKMYLGLMASSLLKKSRL